VAELGNRVGPPKSCAKRIRVLVLGKYNYGPQYGHFDQAAFDAIVDAAKNSRPMRKGDKHSNATRELLRIKHLVRQFFKWKRSRELAEAKRRELAKSRRKGRGFTSQDGRILRAMTPGGFYSIRDVCQAVGIARRTAGGARFDSLERRGLLKRYANADWQPGVRGVAHNSQWLYGLTPAGVERREILLTHARAAAQTTADGENH
jgi:hypothetical protein